MTTEEVDQETLAELVRMYPTFQKMSEIGRGREFLVIFQKEDLYVGFFDEATKDTLREDGLGSFIDLLEDLPKKLYSLDVLEVFFADVTTNQVGHVCLKVLQKAAEA